MLEWLKGHLWGRQDLQRRDAVVVWLGVMLGFFFMLRTSELLAGQGRGWADQDVLTGYDVELRRDNAEAAPADAEEIVVYIKRSKADQYNVGNTRNHFATGMPLSPVAVKVQAKRLCSVFSRFQ